MHAFTAIASLAMLAFGGVASAAPTVRADVQSVPAIFTTLSSQLTPLVDQLKSIDSSNATAAVVGPIADQVTEALSKATTSLSALKGQSQSVLFEDVPLENVAKLVTDVLVLLIPTLGELDRIVGPGGDLTGVLPPIGAALENLLGTLLPTVAGLVVFLIPVVDSLLAGVSGLVTALGLGGLVETLGL